MRLAYLVMLHHKAEVFAKLLKQIYAPEHRYLVHVDARSPVSFQREVAGIISGYPQVEMLPARRCAWGGWSLVQVEWDAITRLLEAEHPWEYFINLSGQDFPLLTQEEMLRRLSAEAGKNYLSIIDQQKDWPESLSRIRYYALEIGRKARRTYIPRRYLAGVKPYAGSQWFILHRDFCRYLAMPEVERYIRFYRNAFIPDESFFQTVIMNSPFRETVVPDCKRYLRWLPTGRPKVLTEQDVEKARSTTAFFARKFEDDSALEKLVQVLANS
jgi:hypothetical protein